MALHFIVGREKSTQNLNTRPVSADEPSAPLADSIRTFDVTVKPVMAFAAGEEGRKVHGGTRGTDGRKSAAGRYPGSPELF
jgi:hypothetical protein